jgi:phosphoenolpyruvate synthase/pyruvate phosphate dikinase
LTIGRLPRLLAKELLGAVDAVRTTGPTPKDAIVGQPASPDRATGPVRIIHGPGDFDRFQPGEVLVAREYGIPAVVATGDATTRLRDGQLVTVDGGAIHPHN